MKSRKAIARKINVLISDDHALMREGIKHVLAGLDADFIEADSVEGVVPILSSSKVDVVIMELKYHQSSYEQIILAKALGKFDFKKVIIHSGLKSQELMAYFYLVGASIVSKIDSVECLPRAVNHVLKGAQYICQYFDNLQSIATDCQLREFTALELKILGLISIGLSSHEIALTT